MLAGLSAALGAGLLWGLVFLTPLLLAIGMYAALELRGGAPAPGGGADAPDKRADDVETSPAGTRPPVLTPPMDRSASTRGCCL